MGGGKDPHMLRIRPCLLITTLKIGFVAGDLLNTKRDLPRVLTLSMIIVIIGFAFMNLSLYANVPFLIVRDSSTPFVVST